MTLHNPPMQHNPLTVPPVEGDFAQVRLDLDFEKGPYDPEIVAVYDIQGNNITDKLAIQSLSIGRNTKNQRTMVTLVTSVYHTSLRLTDDHGRTSLWLGDINLIERLLISSYSLSAAGHDRPELRITFEAKLLPY